jgi:hypothetical protein
MNMLSNEPLVVTLRESALWLAARGWHVFPLVPNGKRPALENWQKAATTMPGKIRQTWARRPFNVGIACGPSGLLVIDMDQPKPGQQLPPHWQQPGIGDGSDVFAVLSQRAGAPFPPETFTVATPSGGMHLYYCRPESLSLGNSCKTRAPMIDTRGVGGLVAAPGSIINGVRYRTINPTPPVALPEWQLAGLLTPPPPRPVTEAVPLAALGAPGQGRRAAYATAGLRNALAAVYAAPGGQRNNTLYASAAAIGQLVAAGDVDHATAEELLITAGTDVGQKPREAAATVRSGITNGARQPREIGLPA